MIAIKTIIKNKHIELGNKYLHISNQEQPDELMLQIYEDDKLKTSIVIDKSDLTNAVNIFLYDNYKENVDISYLDK